MDKNTFYNIMVDIFIEYVKRTREELVKLNPDIDKHAVLIVDGHKSMYDPRTLRALLKNAIILIILPAHSSHLTQPMDLRLNGILKSQFARKINIPKRFGLGFWFNTTSSSYPRERRGRRCVTLNHNRKRNKVKRKVKKKKL